MKPLTLLLCLFLLGCEKRVADPEIEAVREWLLSEEGQNMVASSLERAKTVSDDLRVTLDQLVPCENWIIRRTEFEMFVLYAEEKIGDRGRLFYITSDEVRVMAFSSSPLVTESEFEDLGNPVSWEKALSLTNPKSQKSPH